MIFFDIDDTLTDSVAAHNSAILALAEQHGLDIQDRELAKVHWFNITEAFLERFFKKQITLQEQRVQRLQAFWSTHGDELDEDTATQLYPIYHQLYLKNCLLFPDVSESLEKIKTMPLGIISNGVSADQYFKLTNNAIASYFSIIVISEDIGAAKPDTEIFQQACDRAGLAPSQCTYIGNSYTLDYCGAKIAGLRSLWIDRLNENYTTDKGDHFTQVGEAIAHLTS
ncbi:HAD family hydrolase [Sphingobacterium paucimobilis]|uniref:Haloacid dehalogenase n=1 Tax=Sphingobacterium paucimobilis HER1398 TaxID=1346330 RepID=U2JF75_9SPHI|nr:HAD family hydrolase [Sphingobacterium paucimobilis]ERJ61328.1 hypothetical protein M472_21470 [Sphingobacterium paucimobilis HER1398]